MANTKEIQNRMKSIQDTMKITNAMYMISSTKLRKAKKTLVETEDYFFALQTTMTRILRHMPDMDHRYFASRSDTRTDSEKRQGYIVVTADKGLAGAYNHNVLKIAENKLKDNKNWHLFVIGESGRQFFAAKDIPVDEHFLYTAQNPTLYRARVITERMLKLYDSGQIDEVHVIYTSMKNGLMTETQMKRLLPLDRSSFLPKEVPINVYLEEFLMKPSPESIIENIVPSYITGFMYGALVESFCSEQNARMMAMDAANRAAGEMITHLEVEFNRVRQAMITQEITEVISGAKAQKKRKQAKKKSRERELAARNAIEDGKEVLIQ